MNKMNYTWISQWMARLAKEEGTLSAIRLRQLSQIQKDRGYYAIAFVLESMADEAEQQEKNNVNL